MSFLGEIKRRKIFQVAAVYLVVAWLLIQIVATVETPLNLPDWVDTLVILLLAIGFPVTLVMSWGFNLTPDGLIKDQGNVTSVQGGGKRIEYVLIGLLVVAMVWVIYRVEISPSEQPVKALAEEVERDTLLNSVAVLPFENLSPDPDNAYFAAGIHESTLNQLAKIRDLVVIARTSVMQYEKDPPPIPEIAKALKVETVMEGSVRYANGRVLIMAQLIDGRTGAHLWSDEFNRELVDVFAVQAEVARQIAMALQVQLLPDEQARIEKRPTDSTEAYQHYLHAVSLPNTRLFPEYLPTFIESLKRAIAADPEFAEAYVQLAFGYWTMRVRETATEYAQKSIVLDPTLGTGYAVLALTYEQYFVRQDEAQAAYERAVDLSPNNPSILIEYSQYLVEQFGDFEQGVRLGKRAIAIDPQDESLQRRLGVIYLRMGDLAGAAGYLRAAIRLNSGVYISYIYLAIVEYLNGNHSAAKRNLDRAVQLMAPRATVGVGYAAYVYGLLGEPDQAAQQLVRYEEILDDPGRENWRPLGWAVLGSRDKQRALLEWSMTVDGYLLENRRVSFRRINGFRDNWLNDPMLEQPEFLELRRRLGFSG